jgi:hypothetical protein
MYARFKKVHARLSRSYARFGTIHAHFKTAHAHFEQRLFISIAHCPIHAAHADF